MPNNGGWPSGGLPLGPSAYETAMEPIYDEAVWRERNFYKAEDTPDVATPAPKPAPAPGIVETVTSPIKDFGDWLRPGGAWNWGRVIVIVGGLCVVGYLVGKRK